MASTSTTIQKKSMHPSKNQKSMMIEYLKKNPQLISGKFTVNFTYKDAENSWIDLANILNSMPGSQKTSKNWRKTWQDLRSRTKGKLSTNNKSLQGTGGGPATSTLLDPIEEDILDMIKIVSVEGHSEVLESTVIFDMEDNMNVKDETINGLCSPSTSSSVMEPILHGLKTPTSTLNDVDDRKKNNTLFQNSNKVNNITINDLLSRCTSLAMEETDDRKENDTSPRKILHRKPTRLKHTSILADKHGIYLDKKLLLKEKYYDQKIALMRASVDVKARKAEALERIADALENL